MKDLAARNALAVTSLPTATEALAGVTVRLTSDNKPYWCDGSSWVDLTLTGSGAPGGASDSMQYNAGGSFSGAANVYVGDGDLCLAYSGTPVIPPTDRAKLFGKRFGPSGGRVMPAAVGPSGVGYPLQPAVWQQKVSRWNPPGNGTTVPGVDGMAALTSVGTATARTVAITNMLTRAKRLGYVSSTTAGSLCGHYSTAAQVTTGDGSNSGGFFYSCRFGISDAAPQTAARMFVGLSSSVAAPTNVDPATLTNCIGIGHKASDGNLAIYYGGSAAQPRIDLGANFSTTNIGQIYDFTLWSPPNEYGVVYYSVERMSPGTSIVASGTLAPVPPTGAETPTFATLLAHRAWRTNNTAAAAVGIDIVGVYFETDW